MELARKTIEHDEAFLRQISTPIDFEKDDVAAIIESLKEYCTNHIVYAMAPVQIGIPKRVIYLKNTSEDMTNNENSNYNEACIIINPTIISSKGHTRFLEACESCLDFVGTVDRPYLIEVEYYKPNGKKVVEIFEGFKATVFSHEYDHLNGTLHIDLADDVREMNYEEKKQYRTEHPYEILSKDCDYELKKKLR